MRITGFFVWLKQPRTFQILPGFGMEYDPFCTNLYQMPVVRKIDHFGEFHGKPAISVMRHAGCTRIAPPNWR